MSSRIPMLHRLRHLALFARLSLGYNVGISAIGSVALLVLREAGLIGEAGARVGVGADVVLADARQVASQLDFGLTIFGLLVASLGHWIAILVVSAVHRNEYALYRSAGWSRVELWVASWPATLAVGAVLVALARL